MKTIIPAFVVALAAVSLSVPCARAQEDKAAAKEDKAAGKAESSGKLEKGEAPTTESDFVNKAVARGVAELKFAELGVTKAENPKVKALAEKLVEGHTAHVKELKTIAEKMTLRPDEKTIAKVQEGYKELEKTTVKNFDKKFVAIAVLCHKNNVEFYEAGKKIAKDPAVIAYIDKVLPVLKEHSEKLESLKTD